MSGIEGHTLTTESGRPCAVGRLLGSGGQGEVYQVTVDGQALALKWYFPHAADERQRALLADIVRRGTPTPDFLWPLELVPDAAARSFGYLMPLREPRFQGIVAMMKRKAEPSFQALSRAGYNLANDYFQLHAKGLCYRDISFGNVFLDPASGEVRICDNDNVGVTGAGVAGVLGTPRFMAPEIVRGDAHPCTETDLFSLAVLLFFMFVLHHPLEGQREARIRSLDLPAMRRLYGEEPVFIFDPADDSNRPVSGFHDNALAFWPLYPQLLRDLFVRSFTDGVRDPKNGRVRESEWRRAMAQLRDLIFPCGKCGAELFFDAARHAGGEAQECWACGARATLPLRLEIGPATVCLSPDTRLYGHHLRGDYDFSQPVAEVARHPQRPGEWGLRNLSGGSWSATRADGTVSEVPTGRAVSLQKGLRVLFGSAEGRVQA